MLFAAALVALALAPHHGIAEEHLTPAAAKPGRRSADFRTALWQKGRDRACEDKPTVKHCCTCKKKVCMAEARDGGTCSSTQNGANAGESAKACCHRKREVCLVEEGTCATKK